MNIFVSFVSRSELTKIPRTSVISSVLSYPNVHFSYLDRILLSLGTPIEKFMKSSKLLDSGFTVSHTSDALRYLLLLKYSGVYLDTDMIVRRKIDSTNYVCDEVANAVNGALLALNGTLGRDMARKFIDDLVENYNGTDWGMNGPRLITRVLRDVCKTNQTSEMVKMKNCGGFRVVHYSLCYPINGSSWHKLFNETFVEEAMEKINKCNSTVVHFWNNLSKRQGKLSKNSTCAYLKLAKSYCPKVIACCGVFF